MHKTSINQIVITLLAVLCSTFSVVAQVGVNTDGALPHSSAVLDMKSTEKGFLPPRMTREQRNSLTNPATGMIVFCTDCAADGSGALTIYSNGVWSRFESCPAPDSPLEGFHYLELTQVIWNWNPVEAAIGYKWNSTQNFSTAIEMGENTTHTETGLICNTMYTRYVWAYNACGTSAATPLIATTLTEDPPSPVTGIHVPGPEQIVWNWYPVTIATGYKWSTDDDYASAMDMGDVTNYTETGLICNTPYIRYVWAYNVCGVSFPVSLTGTTLLNPPAAPVAGIHIPDSTQIIWNWEESPAATGYKWSITNDPETATDMGAVTTYTETGLACNTPYTRYVWAYSNCGVSPSSPLTETTLLNPPPAPVAGFHLTGLNQIVWKWNPVSGATGYKWNITNDPETATDMGTDTLKTETGLDCDSICIRYVWAYSNCGISLPAELSDTTLWCCGQPTIDNRDGKSYQTVLIGNQCWFRENLNIGTLVPGNTEQDNHSVIEKYCYDDDEANCNEYGGLYQWDNAMQWSVVPGTQGICPTGWHLPSDEDWTTLTNYLGGEAIAGGALKQAGTKHWASPNTGATNSSGFTALPGGCRYDVGTFQDDSFYAHFWSSLANSSTVSWRRYVVYNSEIVQRDTYSKSYGFSVRCMKNSSTVYPLLNVPGSYQGWAPSDSTTAIPSVTFDEKYEGYMWFPADTYYKYAKGSWEQNWGDNDGNGTLEPWGLNIHVTDEGYYKLNADLMALTHSVTKTSWGVVGTATPGGWNEDTEMAWDPDNKVWTVTMDLSAGDIKFRANGNWDINYGDNGGNGSLEPLGADIPIFVPGNYTVILDLGKPVYTYNLIRNP